ncbi:MAG: HD-GYP domain-containing protein [Armatimonadetes bacterium]|nr:HD-GYP domain-containing protein [Armatimonadota bacterium]
MKQILSSGQSKLVYGVVFCLAILLTWKFLLWGYLATALLTIGVLRLTPRASHPSLEAKKGGTEAQSGLTVPPPLVILDTETNTVRWSCSGDHEGRLIDPVSFLHNLLQEPLGQAVSGLLIALDMRDAETEGHSERVVRYALRMAQEFEKVGLPPLNSEQVRELALGALLHDIGKMHTPDNILFKQSQLTDEEWEIMRQHPNTGAKQLERFPLLKPAIPIVRSHHERWDGMGYPDKKAGDDIPLLARLFALVDTFDAMASNRPYRKASPYSEIRAEIERCAGAQFDPALVTAFLHVPEREWVRLRQERYLLAAPELAHTRVA